MPHRVCLFIAVPVAKSLWHIGLGCRHTTRRRRSPFVQKIALWLALGRLGQLCQQAPLSPAGGLEDRADKFCANQLVAHQPTTVRLTNPQVLLLSELGVGDAVDEGGVSGGMQELWSRSNLLPGLIYVAV